MFASYWTPLAPAAVLLLGAFILSIVAPRLPARWRDRRAIREFGGPILVGLAIVALLGIRLTVGGDPAGTGLELLSGWNFSTVESVATLAVRADLLSLSFLILTFLALLAVTLAGSAKADSVESGAGWLAMGAGACLLFVSANGLTIAYAVLAFDLVTMFYWLGRGQADLGVPRLFLGVVTAGGLVLVTINTTAGVLLFGLALWLRLGLYPLLETVKLTRLKGYGYLVYMLLSVASGLYLLIRMPEQPPSSVVIWLAAITMLAGGLLTWLASERPRLLTRLVATTSLLVLLTGSLPESAATAYALGLTLSLVALWVTPRWGRPHLTERGWPWPYLPAAAATLTLIGLPLSLAWPARSGIYQSLLHTDNFTLIILVMLADALALSGLVSYWRFIWQGSEKGNLQAVAGTVIMVPFLIPGLAPFIFSTLTKTELPTDGLERSPSLYVVMLIVMVGAGASGYFRPQLRKRLHLPSMAEADIKRVVELLWAWLERLLSWLGKFVLRIEIVLQGQHYMGWALATALIGVVIILLGT